MREFIPLRIDSNYGVSMKGEVMSYRRNKLLKPNVVTGGYLTVTLSTNGMKKQCLIHRLVAQTFIPNPKKLPVINHLNGIKSDNRVSNLEWCSQKKNIEHSWEKGLSKRIYNNPKKSKKVRQIDRDGNIVNTFPSMREAERRTGVLNTKISEACKNNGHAKGYKWEVIE